MFCRLCLNNKRERDMIKIFEKKGEILNIAEIINKYFWFEITREDDSRQSVCKPCWKKTNDFHLLYCEVEQKQPPINPIFIPKQECPPAEPIATIEVLVKHENTDRSGTLNAEIHTDIGKVKQEHFENDSEDMPLALLSASRTTNVEETIGSEVSKVNEIKKKDMTSTTKNDEKIMTSVKRSKLPRKTETVKKKSKYTKNKIVAIESKERIEITKKHHETFQKNKSREHKISDFCKMLCEICDNLKFVNWNSMKKHYTSEHRTRGYLYCSCCNKKYFNRSRLLDHIEFLSNPNTFRCSVCNKPHETRGSLKNHSEQHKLPEEKIYKCDKCEKSYSMPYLLVNHLKKLHLNLEKNIECSDCGKLFRSRSIMNSHKRAVHTGVDKQVCEICAKEFKAKAMYENHKRYMHPISPLPKIQCHKCGAWISGNPNSIYRHGLMCKNRDDDGSHVCDICKKSYPHIIALQKHKKYVHVQKKLHQCAVCEKSFNRAIYLKEHMTLHTGEVLYRCPFDDCPRTFNSNANMYAHKKRVHKTNIETSK